MTRTQRQFQPAELPDCLSELRGWARFWIEAHPSHVGMDVDLAVWSMTELVTNSWRHGSGAVGVALDQDSDHLLISVRDSSDGMPQLRHVAPEAESGRGIATMASVANRWGVNSHAGGGKTVWCEFWGE
jgi:two-component sensor histidine kinase